MRHVLREEMRNVGLEGPARTAEEVGLRRSRRQRQQGEHGSKNHEMRRWFVFTGQSDLFLDDFVAPIRDHRFFLFASQK